MTLVRNDHIKLVRCKAASSSLRHIWAMNQFKFKRFYTWKKQGQAPILDAKQCNVTNIEGRLETADEIFPRSRGCRWVIACHVRLRFINLPQHLTKNTIHCLSSKTQCTYTFQKTIYLFPLFSLSYTAYCKQKK